MALPGAVNLPAPDVAVGQQCNNCDQDGQGQRPAVACSVVYADRSEHEKGKQSAWDQDEPGPLGDQGDAVLMSTGGWPLWWPELRRPALELVMGATIGQPSDIPCSSAG